MAHLFKRRSIRTKRHQRVLCRASALLFALLFSLFPIAKARTRVNPTFGVKSATMLIMKGTQTDDKDMPVLKLNVPIERELTGGQAQSYSIKVAAGQYLGVVVYQRGIDVVVNLFAPDGKQLAEVDSPNGTQGPEPVSLVAKVAGSYRLEVRSLENQAPRGMYAVKLEVLGEPPPPDKTKDLAVLLVAAKSEEERATLLAENRQLVSATLIKHLYERTFAIFSQDQLEQAFALYALILKLAEQLNEKKWIASALSGFGAVYERQENFKRALEYSLKSLNVLEELGDKTVIAHMANNVANAYRFTGDLVNAVKNYQKSFTNYEAVGSKRGMALALNGLGLTYNTLGKQALALESFEKSVKVLEATDQKKFLAHTLRMFGTTYAIQGLYRRALEVFQRGLPLSQEVRDANMNIDFLNFIGYAHFKQGNYAQALESYEKGLHVAESTKELPQVAESLMNIGVILRTQNDYENATEVISKGLRIAESLQGRLGLDAVNDRIVIARALNDLGELKAAQDKYEQALEFYQKSLQIVKTFPTDSIAEVEVSLLNNIGNVYAHQGKYQEAMTSLEKSLTVGERVGMDAEVSDVLNTFAEIHRLRSDHDKSLEFANRAANIARRVNNREALWKARTIAGRACRALNQPLEARNAFEEAIAVVEALRTNFASHEARASYFASLQQPYELYIDLLMHVHTQKPLEGHDIAALQISERARSRSLLEALSEANADIREGVDPVLLERERALQQQLNARAERQTRLLATMTNSPTQPLPEIQKLEQSEALQKELAALSIEYQQVQTQIRRSSPRYAALTQPVPLNLREIQSQVLDADTLLLEYALGEERSYLWAVTQSSINSFELPKRDTIEAAVRRVYDFLSIGKQWVENDQINAQYAESAGNLIQMLLPASVDAQLKGKRLMIVGDGALQYLPFGALLAPKHSGARRVPLIVEHEIVSLPSASTLSVLRRETVNRARAQKSIAVLADPVFTPDDERVKSPLSSNQEGSEKGAEVTNGSVRVQTSAASQSSLSRSYLLRALDFQPYNDTKDATRAGELRIRRLPFTRREAEAILAVSPITGMKALDFRASRETATNRDLAQYRIIHFATHGLLNSEHPELSGIVLSLVNEAGQPVDGFLRLHEIYNLKLSADLVVLSACQTALGKEIRGEGLVGLTRGFMYAGAPRVVASLWKVDDAATAELMKRFYEGMLIKKMRPAEALRAAKVEMWKQKRWQAPFYWAAFELQGEWK